MALKLITPPSSLPVSLAEMKEHLRVDHADEDLTISGLIRAAVGHLDGKDGWLGRSLMPQTWELQLDAFPDAEIEIPLPPLQSVVSVTFIDGAGTTQTLGADGYVVDAVSEPGWIVPALGGWPATMATINAVKIRFLAGYPGDMESSPPDPTAGVPDVVKQAIKLYCGHWYRNKEAVVAGQAPAELPMAVQALLAPLKVWRF